MEVICLQDEVFYALIDKVLERIKEKDKIKEDEWISTDETMKMLRIKSKATLQKLRDSGQIVMHHLLTLRHPQPNFAT